MRDDDYSIFVTMTTPKTTVTLYGRHHP